MDEFNSQKNAKIGRNKLKLVQKKRNQKRKINSVNGHTRYNVLLFNYICIRKGLNIFRVAQCFVLTTGNHILASVLNSETFISIYNKNDDTFSY